MDLEIQTRLTGGYGGYTKNSGGYNGGYGGYIKNISLGVHVRIMRENRPCVNWNSSCNGRRQVCCLKLKVKLPRPNFWGSEYAERKCTE